MKAKNESKNETLFMCGIVEPAFCHLNKKFAGKSFCCCLKEELKELSDDNSIKNCSYRKTFELKEM